MNGDPIALGIWAWFFAAGLTWIITKTSIFAPLRTVHEARYKKRASALLSHTIRPMPDDHPRRWAAIRKYEWLVAYAEAPGCRMCVGFWMYVLCVLAAWVALGCPGGLWGGPALFTLPAAVMSGWFLFVVVTEWIDPSGRQHNLASPVSVVPG